MSTDSTNVVFFGDSICFGQGVSIHRGWVPRLSAEVEKIAIETGRDALVINTAINGNTTRQALERMPYDVQSHGVDILIVQFGINDCNCWKTDRGLPRVSPAAFRANLAEIVDRGIAFGAKHVFLHTNHPTTRTDDVMAFTDKTYQQSNEEYNDLIRAAAADLGHRVVLIDLEKAILEPVREGTVSVADMVLPDGLHLSPRGHDIYFETVGPILLPRIREVLA